MPTKFKLKVIKDIPDGVLCIAEGGREVPFEIRRVYFIDEVNKSSLRGFHAHKKLEQMIYCLRGSCEIEMHDREELKTLKLESKSKEGVYLGTLVWHSLRKFSNDCLLVVFASDHYDEHDYIRDFSEFRRL